VSTDTRLPETTEDDLLEFLEIMKKTPLRTMADIANNREPTVIVPVLAKGMQADTVEIPKTMAVPHLPRHLRPYRGPKIWQLSKWLLWNFGWFYWGLNEQNRHRSHRVV
jgi:hypothetical protein